MNDMNTSNWARIFQIVRKRERMRRVQDHYRSILDKCIKHANDLYMKRYIFRHSYTLLTEKIRVCNTSIQSENIREIIKSFDTLVYSCGIGTIQDSLEYFAVPSLRDTWVDTLCVPIVISRERGGITSSFFRSPAIVSSNSTESTRGLWYSISGRKDYHFAFKLIIERDTCGILNNVFRSKKRMLSEDHQELFHLLPEKAIITETVSELRSRIIHLEKTRERLGKTPISKLIQEFMNADIPKQVTLLCAMILKDPKYNNQDLSHLVTIIYDITANRTIVNKRDIPDLIDSLPWEVQRRIRELRKHPSPENTIEEDDVPTETRIQMLHVNDAVKKLAMNRLKESNVRSGGGVTGSDGSSKAGSWVEGLLRIPFGTYRKEPVLCLRDQTIASIHSLLGDESKYIECSTDLYGFLCSDYPELVYIHTETNRLCWTREILFDALRSITKTKGLRNIAFDLGIVLDTKRITRRLLTQAILTESTNYPILEVYDVITLHGGTFPERSQTIVQSITEWNTHVQSLGETIDRTREILDTCVHKQDRAKEQVLRIMGQWMVGENHGYCLGFEGPPGVGKTTLAREGIAKILSDANGSSRPFHMIALGTATTGSTLVGHNYTYHGSTWGDIARILMESQCMNPIIYIDELDKVSRTESGREIIGILTHLTDPAQNEEFQDRYFAGVKLDLSRVLFVFSYNDPSLIDPILLDRVHRVRFEPLTMTDKVNIAMKYTLPQICSTLRLPRETTLIEPNTVKYIVRNYTHEAGVRRLREILFDTFREINLRDIRNENGLDTRIPTIEFVEDHILRHKSRPHRVIADHTQKQNRVYGMFATNSGMGGILPIKVCKDHLGEKDQVRVTGSLGDVMKESVSVARSLVSEYVSVSGAIHIHFPEGATPKDGPSAGSAITLAMYSFYTKKKIPGNLALTGEIDIDGSVLPIGGVQAKLTGAKMDGIEWVILPEQNTRDFRIACEIIPRDEMPERVDFVSEFQEILELLFPTDE
jgi:hypothetical protein